MRLQTEFHDLLTQVAEAKDMAGSLVKMLWRRSLLRTLMPVMGSIEDFPLELDRDDDEHGGSSIVVVRVRLVNAKCGGVELYLQCFDFVLSDKMYGEKR